MKKKVLLTAGLAAAMTAGMAMTALAGWEEHYGSWYYYKDSNHEMVTDDWAQSGDFWYYLGEDGRMVTSKLINDTYYVDHNGAMTVNGWQWVVDEWDDEDEGAWRYFGANGRIYRDGIKNINGYSYHFADTKMSTGWVDEGDYTYYFKEDGSMATGWKWLLENSDDEDSWGEHWYYFSNGGKLTKSTVKEISGVDYAFDGEGRMLTGWVDVDGFTSSSMENLNETNINELKYFDGETGAAAEGWLQLDSPSDHESHTYYFRDGRAYSTANKTTVLNGYGIAKIEDDYYCFDENGHMVTGLVESGDGPMYFDTNTGKMSTGRVTVYDDNYWGVTFCFKENGSIGTRGIGIDGVYDGYLYKDGQAVCAEEGMKYAKVSYGDHYFIVNESGKIKTSGTATDADGNKWKITKVSTNVYTITDVAN